MTKFYAGIGSRETPDHILGVMQHIAAYLYTKGWILRSGGADGADHAFEDGVPEPEGKEIYLPWRGFNNHGSPLHPTNYPFTDLEVEAAMQFHPAWDRCSSGAKALHTRNVRQIAGCAQLHDPYPSFVKFVVCWTVDAKGKGGTGQALRMAHHQKIPVIDFGLATTDEQIKELMLEVDRLQATF